MPTTPASVDGDSLELEIQPGELPYEHAQLAAYAADLSRVYRRLREAQARLEESYLSTLTALVAVVEARDDYLKGHSRSVADYALAVGRQMGLESGQLEALARGALLHDIGKIGVPDAILKKIGPLDEAEWRQMRHHPELSYYILSSLDFLGEALLGIRHHHERYDGHGYPLGLAGDSIPLIARILSVCDAFDAMTSDRPYRRAMTPESAVQELVAKRGSQFDPEVVDPFLRVVRRWRPDARGDVNPQQKLFSLIEGSR